jgi:hypothetical protein
MDLMKQFALKALFSKTRLAALSMAAVSVYQYQHGMLTVADLAAHLSAALAVFGLRDAADKIAAIVAAIVAEHVKRESPTPKAP